MLMQELHIHQPDATAIFMDSSTTISVANNDASAGRSLWLRRRVRVLHAHADSNEVVYNKIPEEKNCSDAHTKYLTFARWKRHMGIILNISDEDYKNVKPVTVKEQSSSTRPVWAAHYTLLEAKRLLAQMERDAKAGDEEAASHLASRAPTLRAIISEASEA
jgi:hypothetical protein